MIDLVLSPIFLESGQERKELPGLYAAPSRKTSRLRVNDRVISFLASSGSETLPHNLLQELLARLAETYYTSSGSVTFGMKAMADRLNDFLINRNLRQSRQQGGQAIGVLNMVVLHGTSLYVGHAGPTHTYLISSGQVEHFTDLSGVGRSLGLARLVSLRFFQTTFEPGASLLLSASAAPGWSDAALLASASLDAPAARKQLQAGLIDLQACFVRTAAGKGQVRWEYSSTASAPAEVARSEEAAPEVSAPSVPPKKPAEPQWIPGPAADRTAPVAGPSHAPDTAAPVAGPAPLQAAPGSGDAAGQGPIQGVYLTGKPLAEPVSDRAPWEEPPAPAAPAPQISAPPQLEGQVSQPASRPRPGHTTPRPPAPVAPAQVSTAARGEPARPATASGRKNGFRPSPAAAGLARFFSAAIAGIRRLGSGLNKFLARVLPDQPEEGVQLSPGTKLFIALAIPVVVVAVAATIYNQVGRGERQVADVQTARQFATQASTRQDVELRIRDWKQALTWLDQADSHGGSKEATQLRSQIQDGLDGLDGVVRLAYRPAMTAPLAEKVQISRIVPNVNDIYLLDSSQGRILRVYRSGQTTYELDINFSCAPGKYDTVIVEKLIDIAPLPPDNIDKAAVMGMDSHGNLLYCGPNNPPSVHQLEAPDMNWGKPSRAVYFQDVLYVLDSQTNQVYRYLVTNGKFTGKPRLYFDETIPHLSDVVDIGVDQEDLYLLHADGSMTTCDNSGLKTTCDDPAAYGDTRAGYDPAPLKFSSAVFNLMQVSQPPDPSLYILDTRQNSIYHFSLRKLNLQRMYRPQVDADYPPPDRQPSAFVVTPNRRVILAVDNQLYFATLP